MKGEGKEEAYNIRQTRYERRWIEQEDGGDEKALERQAGKKVYPQS